MDMLATMRQEVDRLKQRLVSSLVKRGMISIAPSSSYFMQTTGAADAEAMEETESFQHFGFASRPPADSEVMLLCPGARGEDAVAVAENNRAHRPADLEAEETCLYGKKGTGQATVRLKPNERVIVKSGGASPCTLTLYESGKAVLENAGASMEITAGGAVNIDAGLLQKTTITGLDHLSEHRGPNVADRSRRRRRNCAVPEDEGGLMGKTFTRYLNDQGEAELDSTGRTVKDNTVRTKALIRLTTRRGEYWADVALGSRLHTIRTLSDGQAKFLPYCKEALEPLLTAGDLVEVKLGAFGVRQDPSTGALLGHLELVVPDNEIIGLQALPIGR